MSTQATLSSTDLFKKARCVLAGLTFRTSQAAFCVNFAGRVSRLRTPFAVRRAGRAPGAEGRSAQGRRSEWAAGAKQRMSLGEAEESEDLLGGRPHAQALLGIDWTCRGLVDTADRVTMP